MKTLSISVLWLCLWAYTKAQMPVFEPYQNTPAAAVDINTLSFYVDSVTSTNERVVSFANAADYAAPMQSVNITGTLSGVHQLYAKVTNANGNPSIINVGNFYMEGDNRYQNIPATAFDINTLRFYVDSVTNNNERVVSFANTADYAMPMQSINITGTASGVHQLYAKVTNTNGNPSIINVGNFYMDGDNRYQNIPTTAFDINKLSLYVDSVTNTNEQVVSFANIADYAAPMQSVNVAGTISGVHQLYAKVTNTNGNPSIINVGNFYMEGDNRYQNIAPVAPNITRYEFFIDSINNAIVQPLAFTPASSNTTINHSIDLSAVIPGIHQLYAKVFDADGKQSIVNWGLFNMEQNFRYPNTPSVAPALANMEYFIDNEPGYGNGTPITIPINSLDIVLSDIDIPIPNTLPLGTHYFHIRSKQNPWSINAIIPIEVSTPLPATWQYIKAQLNNSDVLVSWGIAQEYQIQSYTIEHSNDGVVFTPLTTIQAFNNSNTQTYTFKHANVSAGLHYYRIKQLDALGSSKYSPIVQVLYKHNIGKPILAPTIVTANTNIIFNTPTEKMIMHVYNSKGQLVHMQAIADGTSLLTYNASLLAKGQYTVTLTNQEHKNVLTLIKQ